MHIGRLRISHPFTQAPLEEHSNAPFRMLMKRHGASLTCSERVDAAQAVRRDRRAMRTLATSPAEAPRAGQISGADPADMAEAARIVESLGYDLVDLNFDCPVRRLFDSRRRRGLLADPPQIERIVAAVVRGVSIPVSLKIRSGPDAARETAVEVSRRAEAAGAAAVSVHARSVTQGYVGDADWSVIARVKQAVRIPVLGGGSVRTAADAVRLLSETGADAVAIGRGCLGNPWIFEQARSLWTGGAKPPEPTAAAARSRDAATGRGRVSLLRPDRGPASFAANELLLRQVPARLPRIPHGRAKSAESRRFPPTGERSWRLMLPQVTRCVPAVCRAAGRAASRSLLRRAFRLLPACWPACRASRGVR